MINIIELRGVETLVPEVHGKYHSVAAEGIPVKRRSVLLNLFHMDLAAVDQFLQVGN